MVQLVIGPSQLNNPPPTGAVLPLTQLQNLIRLAREYDFVIASDECYSEIYPQETAPPQAKRGGEPSTKVSATR